MKFTENELKSEEWKDIEEYEGLYQVSSLGRVKSLARTCTTKGGAERTVGERILKPVMDRCGYLQVCIHNEGKLKMSKVHRLVGDAFIPNPNGYPQINHKNEDKTDNRVENLEWCTAQYNSNYGTRTERISKQVYLLDKETNEIINVFPSASDVERQLGFSKCNISKCCNGKLKSAYGYKWSYNPPIKQLKKEAIQLAFSFSA